MGDPTFASAPISPQTVTTVFPWVRRSPIYPMAAAASPSWNVLSMNGVTFPASGLEMNARSVWLTPYHVVSL